VAAPNVRVTPTPFSSPELPALLTGGLGRDLPVQLERGRQVIATLLGARPSTSVLRPPGAVVDAASLRELAQQGIGSVVVGPGTVVPTPQPLGFAGPPVAAIGNGDAVEAIVPEPAVATILQGGLVDQDPVLTAQIVLGELASIWQERPGEPRGIAVVLPEDGALPAGFYVPFARVIAGAPWLRPMHAAELAAAFPATEPTPLAPAILRAFGSSYVEQLKQARRLIVTYRSMLAEESDAPARLEDLLLLAESRQFLSNPSDGLAFIARARDAVESVFGGISLQTVDVITLTSSSGSGIPVTVSNGSEEALHLTLRLDSQNLREPESSELELGPGASETVRFNVELKTTGRFQVQVQVVSPGGRVIQAHSIVVRSTAYNRTALIITGLAALALLVLWARRFVPRRTS
ncbi:MAG TPA: DUF6049 family protein, partial [Actinomycetota bacterium]|nr:DUF6049 family protein [Actinomycetota bacterium]